ERNLSHTPFFQVVFSLQAAAADVLELDGLKVTSIESETGTSKFDLVFSLNEKSGRLEGTLEYSTDLFAAQTIEQMLSHYVNLLRAVVAEPESTIEQLSLLGAAERTRLLIDWNRTATNFPREATIAELFERQVAARPE